MHFSDLLSMPEWANKLKLKLILIRIKFIPPKFISKNEKVSKKENGKSNLLERNEAKHSISFLASQNKHRIALSEPRSLKARNG